MTQPHSRLTTVTSAWTTWDRRLVCAFPAKTSHPTAACLQARWLVESYPYNPDSLSLCNVLGALLFMSHRANPLLIMQTCCQSHEHGVTKIDVNVQFT